MKHIAVGVKSLLPWIMGHVCSQHVTKDEEMGIPHLLRSLYVALAHIYASARRGQAKIR